MSSMSDTGPQGAWRGGACGRSGWKPVELLAMVLGFMVFWPIGVGVIAWKYFRRGDTRPADWFGAMRDRFERLNASGIGPAARPDWSGFGFGQSGNAAFDEWRKQEIERLDQERRKLEAAQKDFAAFVDQARRARDREEFERFMRDRSGGVS